MYQGYCASNGCFCCFNYANGCSDGCCSTCTGLAICNDEICN